MAYSRREYSGDAVATTLAADIDATATTIPISLTAGWPTGQAGKFLIVIGRETASEEKIFVQTRSGPTLTLQSSGDRGAEGTTGQGHSAGDTVEHVIGSTDADEANYAVSQTVGQVTTKGDLLFATAANTFGRQAAGANNTVLVADNAQTNGAKYVLLDGSNVSTALAGNGLSGGNGQPLSTNVDNSTLEINSDALRAKDGGITNAKLAGGITQDKLAGGITPAQTNFGAWTAYTPSWTVSSGSVGLGASTLVGAYFIVGKLYFFNIAFRVGSGASFGSGSWSFSLGGGVVTAARDQTVAGFIEETSPTVRYAAAGLITATSSIVTRIAIDGSVGAGAGVPFSWAPGDKLILNGVVEIA